jgi:hypothetical protein
MTDIHSEIKRILTENKKNLEKSISEICNLFDTYKEKIDKKNSSDTDEDDYKELYNSIEQLIRTYIPDEKINITIDSFDHVKDAGPYGGEQRISSDILIEFDDIKFSYSDEQGRGHNGDSGYPSWCYVEIGEIKESFGSFYGFKKEIDVFKKKVNKKYKKHKYNELIHELIDMIVDERESL